MSPGKLADLPRANLVGRQFEPTTPACKADALTGRPQMGNCSVKEHSPEIYFVRSTETDPPWSSLNQILVLRPSVRLLRGVTVSLERR